LTVLQGERQDGKKERRIKAQIRNETYKQRTVTNGWTRKSGKEYAWNFTAWQKREKRATDL
jgi:hypothetical protein